MPRDPKNVMKICSISEDLAHFEVTFEGQKVGPSPSFCFHVEIPNKWKAVLL